MPARSAQYELPTTGSRDQAAQGRAIQSSASELIRYIQQNRDLFGPTMGRYAHLQDWLGTLPPEAAGALTRLLSFDALQPYLHRFRGTNALEEFENAIGGMPRNPDGLIAGIKGVLAGAAVPLIEQGTVKTTGNRASTGGGGATPKPKTPAHAAAAAANRGGTPQGGSNHLDNLYKKYNIKPVGQ